MNAPRLAHCSIATALRSGRRRPGRQAGSPTNLKDSKPVRGRRGTKAGQASTRKHAAPATRVSDEEDKPRPTAPTPKMVAYAQSLARGRPKVRVVRGEHPRHEIGRDRALGGGFQPDALESAKLAAHSAAFRAAASAVSRFLAASASRSPLSRASLRSASLFSLRPCLVAFVIVKILVSHIERAGLRAVRPHCAIHVRGDMRAVFVDRKKGAVRARINSSRIRNDRYRWRPTAPVILT
jgi:hypothetical protein